MYGPLSLSLPLSFFLLLSQSTVQISVQTLPCVCAATPKQTTLPPPLATLVCKELSSYTRREDGGREATATETRSGFGGSLLNLTSSELTASPLASPPPSPAFVLLLPKNSCCCCHPFGRSFRHCLPSSPSPPLPTAVIESRLTLPFPSSFLLLLFTVASSVRFRFGIYSSRSQVETSQPASQPVGRL
uniref:Putative secreted protein n=1 Tax=Anopheles darlingi TaxID=43151 RepID=A0A2M4DIT6_ANODA